MPLRVGLRELLDVINRKKEQNKCQSLITEITNKFKPITDNGKIIGVETFNGNKGFVSNESGIHILRLRGNQFEMGFQHGYLLADKIQEPQYIDPVSNKSVNVFKYWSDYVDNMLRSFLPGFEKLLKYDLAPWAEEAVLADRIPDDVFRSLVGVHAGYWQRLKDIISHTGNAVNGEFISLLDFIRGYVQPDVVNILIKNIMTKGSLVGWIINTLFRKDQRFWPKAPIGSFGCTTMGILAGKTKDQDLLVGCNFDYDPLAGIWEKNLTLIYADPVKEDDYEKSPQPFIAVTSAGVHTAGLMGVNQKGIVYRVNMNFTKNTDKEFRRENVKHGQPILNYGDHLLKYGESIENNNDLFTVFEQIKSKINCRGKVSDLAASGWALIAGQYKDSKHGNVTIFETDFKRWRKTKTLKENNFSTIPIKYSQSGWRAKHRFVLLSELDEIKSNDNDIQAIWQTNYYTSPEVGKKDILMRRTFQLDKINRFLLTGESIKKLYPEGKITWQDIACILSDNTNIFTGNKKRLNVGLIPTLANVTSIIFSVKPDQNNNLAIKVYLAAQEDPDKRNTPTANWPYVEIDFENFKTRKSSYFKKIPDHPNPKLRTDPYTTAMDEYYKVYCYYTFTNPHKLDDAPQLVAYKTIYEGLLKVRELFPANEIDPYIDFMIGRVLCNLVKKHYIANAKDKVDEYLDLAVESFDRCLKNDYLHDPHLIMLAKLFYVRLGINSRHQAIRGQAEMLYDKFRIEVPVFEDLSLKDNPELIKALSVFTKNEPAGNDVKLNYFRDKGLIHSIKKLRKRGKLKFDLRDIEEDLTFNGPEPLLELNI